MTTKHTPGPWAVKDSKLSISVHSEDSDYSVCSLSVAAEYARSPSVARANARLIAEAPAMLEALRNLAGHFPDLAEVDLDDDERAAIEQARAILNKLEG